MARSMHEAGSVLKNVKLSAMRCSEDAQRKLRVHRVDELSANFDPEFFGTPVVNFRAGHYWIIDGQHRVEAVKQWLGKGSEEQSVTCRCYTGMSEKEEAVMYLKLNNQLGVGVYDRFKVALTAQEPAALAVRGAVHKAGLRIGINRDYPNSVLCVSMLGRIFARSDAANLTRALKLAHQCFGEPGLLAPVIDGMARVCERYNSKLKDTDTVETMSNVHGGVGALLTKATYYRKTTGNQAGYCFAAAVVDALNAKGKLKLPSWWKDEK